MKRNSALLLVTLCFQLLIVGRPYGQSQLPYNENLAFAMDANVKPALEILGQKPNLTGRDSVFKALFTRRFGKEEDLGEYPKSGNDKMDELLGYFRTYWRKSLLNPSQDEMGSLANDVMPFLAQNHPKFNGPAQRDSLGNYLADYIRSLGFHTTQQINPTGRLVDLLVWNQQLDITYRVQLGPSENIDVRVVFMKDFVSLGWMEYASLGRHHPGGWTTDDALFCVEKSYDTSTENFHVSYLAHEARHFADKKVFRNLTSSELEYRAKLTELNLADASLYNLIEFFVDNANAESQNGHQQANHLLIQNFSKKIMRTSFQGSMDAWRAIRVKKINKVAIESLKEDTERLKKKKY